MQFRDISGVSEAITAKRKKIDPYCQRLNRYVDMAGCSPTMVSNKGGVGKISSFLILSVNIWKTVADTAKVTIND